MTISTRLAAAMFCATALVAGPALADFPDKPITVIVPFSPGGGTDTLARVLTDKMSQEAGQPFVVDNHPGAGGTLGVSYTAKQPADGYTIVLVNALNHTAGVNFYDDIDYDPVKDFTAVGSIGAIRYELIVNPDFPAQDYESFVDLVKQHPGEYNYASAGVGSSPHLAMELFKSKTGLDIVHVPYQGSGPALNDVVAGVVPMLFESSGPTELIKAGRLHALAITGDTRSDVFPDVPTFKEVGLSDFDVTGYWGFIGPKGMDPAVVQKLNDVLKKTVEDPDVQQKLKSMGIDPVVKSPEEYGQIMQEEQTKWDGLIESEGLKK